MSLAKNIEECRPLKHIFYGGDNMNLELLQNEQIKQIINYPEYYITSFGRVWSTYCGGHWLKPTISKQKYHRRAYVSLGRGNKKYVHRLVAEAFIPNPNNLTEIDHIDTDSLNNRVENLRWVTHQQNMDNIITKEHIKHNTGYYCQIEEIATGRTFLGYAAVAKEFNVCEQTVLNHINCKVKNPRWRLTGKRVRPEKN